MKALVRGERLVTKISRNPVRVIELVAPAGFGKTALAVAFGDAVGAYALVAPGSDGLARLLEENAGRDFVAIVDDADRIAESDLSAVGSAIELAGPGARIVICSRRKTNLHRGLTLPPNERLTLTADDLAFRSHEALRVFEDVDVDPDRLKAMIDYCEGWPVAVLSMRTELDGGADIRAVAGGRLESLDSYLVERVISTLDEDERTALLLCCGLPGLRREQLVSILQKPGTAFALLDLQLARADRFGGIVVRPLLAAIAHDRFHAEMNDALERAARSLSECGDARYAAAAYLALGDIPRANSVLAEFSTQPKQLLAFPFHAIAQQTRERLDAASLKAYPEIWAALFLERQFLERPDALLQDVQDIAELLRPANLTLRNVVLSLGALLSVQTGRIRFAYDLLQVSTPSEGEDASVLASATAMLESHLGDLRKASVTWLKLRPHFWGYHAWSVFMMRVELKAARASLGIPGALGIIDRLCETAEKSGSPLLAGYASAMAAFTALLFGDEPRMELHLKQLHQMLAACPSVHLQAVADTISGRDRAETGAYPLYEGWAQLVRAASAPLPRAIELVRRAIEIGDACEDVGLRTVSRAALARLEPNLRSDLLAEARGMFHGDLDLDFVYASYDAFLRRYSREATTTHAPSGLRVEVASGRILRDGKPVEATLKTHELLVALAAEGHPVPRETLLERLWPDQSAEDARNALKMCVYRARQQLDDAEIVTVRGGLYELGPHVQTDIHHLFDDTGADREQLFEALSAGRPSLAVTWPWFAAIESRLVARTAELGLALATDALKAGEIERALRIASILTTLDPCDELATELAIRVHLQRGERGSAVNVYRRLLRSLKDELDVEPSESIRNLLSPTLP